MNAGNWITLAIFVGGLLLSAVVQITVFWGKFKVLETKFATLETQNKDHLRIFQALEKMNITLAEVRTELRGHINKDQ